MKHTTCRDLSELRSAYLDGALGDDDREQVLSHLVACESCRREVADLQRVRLLLRGIGTSSDTEPAPNELSSRLISIAGEDAYSPVWSRPFRRTRVGALPSARRTKRIRTAAAAFAFGTVVSGFGVLGYVAAPSVELAAIADPSDRVRSEFALTLTQLPLSSRSINAVTMVPDAQLQTDSAQPPEASDVRSVGHTLSTRAAISQLRRAAVRSGQVNYSGIQEVFASWGGQTIAAKVLMSFDPGQGSTVAVQSKTGQVAGQERFVPISVSTRSSNDETLSLLIKNYHVSGWAGSRVAGRSASVVEASPAWSGASAPSLIGGGLSARWWIDDKTGLLLWQETYDAAGSLVLSSGFTQVTIGGASDFNAHLPPQMAVSTTTAVLTLSNARALSDLGWACQDELAGLSLIRLRGDAAANPDVLHLVYSDGVSTLTVFEQHGRLTGAPAGAHWDRALGAYVRPGTPTMATWQSGGTVLTVATDGSEDLMATAVGSLPHQASHSRTTMDRVRAGWLRILHLVIG